MLTTNARDAVLGWMSTFTLNIDYVFRSVTAEFKTSCCPPQADFFRFLGQVLLKIIILKGFQTILNLDSQKFPPAAG